jgi:phospholipase/carboxylesterase
MVIPRELLDRTWQYLHADSGADVRGKRGPGGHGLSQAALDELNRWLTAIFGLEHLT